jgi:protein TonB
MAFVASSDVTTFDPAAHGFRGEAVRPRPSHSLHRTLMLVTSDGISGGAHLLDARTASAQDVNAAVAVSQVHAPKRPAQWLRNTAILFSFCLHAAIALSMLDLSDVDEQFGTLADKTDAISMATEQTVVLESIETETVQTAAAASAASQAGSVQSANSVPQPLTEVKEAVEATTPPPEPVEVADVTPSAAAPTEDPLSVIRGGAAPDDVSEVKAVETSETVEEVKPTEVAAKEVVEEDERKEDAQERERQVTAQAASRASAAGSTTSRASAAQTAVSGRVSASRGNILNYAARIRAILARHKPAGDGHRGTARISFGLTEAGDLSYVQVASSSGKATLDQAALGAVRQAAPFGPAPADASLDQLRFTIPFYFR